MTNATRCKRISCLLIIWSVTCFFVSIALSEQANAGSEINTGYFGNVAIKGYDPVAYFTRNKAMMGREDYTHKWLGVRWRFANEDHMKTFAANPVKYAPQYGGHCAVGTSSGGLTVDIDPEAWSIIDGKLYLNYSKEVNKRLSKKRIKKADANWQKLRKEAVR